MDSHSSITGTSSMVRTPCMPGMGCIYLGRVFGFWPTHSSVRYLRSSTFFVSQVIGRACEERRKEKLVKFRKVTSTEKARNSLSVYYTNCRSIMNKIDLLRGMASVEKFDIIALTETWLDMSGKVFDTEVKIDGYTLFYKDRENRRGGGVALYVRDTLQCSINGRIKTDNKTESLWVDIKEGSQAVVIGVVYRPPRSTMEVNTSLWQELNRASKYTQMCVVGDFNFRSIDWDLMVGNSEAEEFLKVIQDNFLKRVILEPTRGIIYEI